MPLKKFCARSGCNQLISIGQRYCTIHQLEYEENQKKRHRKYKQEREDKDIQKIYINKRWEQVREQAKQEQKGLDLYSYFINGKIEYAEIYHHIIEVKEDISRAYDIDNVFGLTESNHQIIHELYKKDEQSKKEMQDLLFKLLARWKAEYLVG